MNPTERAYKLTKIKQYKQTLAPQWQRGWAEDLSSTEAKIAADADRAIENENKNHSESMASMEDLKTVVMQSELSILEHMQQRMMPLPNQVDTLGTLLQKTLSA